MKFFPTADKPGMTVLLFWYNDGSAIPDIFFIPDDEKAAERLFALAFANGLRAGRAWRIEQVVSEDDDYYYHLQAVELNVNRALEEIANESH